MSSTPTTAQRIAAGYAAVIERGQRATVRAVREASGVRTNEVAAWLRDHATGTDLPPAPDFSESVAALTATLWASAWTAAHEEATATTSDALEAARTGEAEALDAADAARAAQEKAEADRDRTAEEVARLTDDRDRLRVDLDRLRTEAEELRRAVRDAETRAARAEATADTLRQVLDGKDAPTTKAPAKKTPARKAPARKG